MHKQVQSYRRQRCEETETERESQEERKQREPGRFNSNLRMESEEMEQNRSGKEKAYISRGDKHLRENTFTPQIDRQASL